MFYVVGDQSRKMIVQISSQLANCSKLQRLYFGSGTTPTQRFNLFKAVQVRHLAFLASFLSELFFKGIICDSRQQFNLQRVLHFSGELQQVSFMNQDSTLTYRCEPPNKGYVRHYEGTSRTVILYSSVFYCTPTFYLRMASISRSTVAAATGVSVFSFGVQNTLSYL